MLNRRTKMARAVTGTNLFIIIAAAAAAADPTASTPAAVSLGCGYYERGPADASILDCRPSGTAAQAYTARGYTVRRKIFIPVGGAAAWHGRPVWTLSPPLTSTEAINSLPPDAFALAKSDEVDALSLRRLHQTDGLDLTALRRLRMLSRLELAETNATCVQRGLFSTAARGDSANAGFAAQLVSLRLTDNIKLECIQPGALDELVNLAELSISGSPRLKSLGGAPALPALVQLELPTRMSAALEHQFGAEFCNAGASLRQLTIDSRLALLWKPPIRLANLTSLRVQPSPGEAMEAIVQRLVLSQQTALCAVWPTGYLRLNDISIASFVADQLAMDFAEEFCSDVGEAVLQYRAQAEQRCGSQNDSDIASCNEACKTERPSTPASTTEESPTRAPATVGLGQRKNYDEPLKKSQGDGNKVGSPGLDSQGIIGTTLLTAGAFLGGALIAAYCFHSRRRMAAAARLKLTGGATITDCPAASLQPGGGGKTTGTAAAAAATAKERGEREEIRLIGYTAGLGDIGSRVVVFKEADSPADNEVSKPNDATGGPVKTINELENDGALLTAEL